MDRFANFSKEFNCAILFLCTSQCKNLILIEYMGFFFYKKLNVWLRQKKEKKKQVTTIFSCII